MNSAQRLHHLFVQFRSIKPETSVRNMPPSGVDAWSTLFERHGPAGLELDEIAAESALAVNQEVAHLGVLLRDRGVPVELYQPHLTQLKSVTSTRNMHSHWDDIAKMVREEQIVMLQWAGFVLGPDGSTDIADEVKTLAVEIDKLISDIESSNLPSTLRLFLLRHLRAIRSALWNYKVSGTERLRDAMQSINGISGHEAATLSEVTQGLSEQERSIMQRVGKVVGDVANACDIATKIQGGYALAATAATMLGLSG
ncbi:hypothetical protein ACFOHT_03005 [Massilia oculi]|jgi:hypothetical protein|nr:hypothetical protein [Massilia oculi]